MKLKWFCRRYSRFCADHLAPQYCLPGYGGHLVWCFKELCTEVKLPSVSAMSSLPRVELEDSVEGGGMDAEGASVVADRFSFFKRPLGKISLLGIHLFRPSEADASPLCVRATGTRRVTLDLLCAR